jgi:hypothetical protein
LEVEQTIKINEHDPKEIYYFRQLCDSEFAFFTSPWGGLIIKNCEADGKLLEFHNVAGFETFRKETREPMWLYLKLKVFQFNASDIFGVFVCPECPSMAGTDELQVKQDPLNIIPRLCIHSRVSTIKLGDWRSEWTISLSTSDLSFHVIPNQECDCATLVPKSSDAAFLAAVRDKRRVSLLFCATKRQAHPFCSLCTNRKCHHFVLYEKSEASLNPEPVQEEQYEPSHDCEEPDDKYNDHYMNKPPDHIRGHMYGYNLEDIIFPFSDSCDQQRVWLERVSGVVHIPSRLEPVIDIESKCKHNAPFDNSSEALVTESKSVVLFNDLGERIFPSEVLARPTLGPCKCLKRFDGSKLLIWNLGKGRGALLSTFSCLIHNAGKPNKSYFNSNSIISLNLNFGLEEDRQICILNPSPE